MSAENPQNNESAPAAPIESAPAEPLEVVAARNAVPQTPEAPHEAIADRRERLARNATPRPAGQTAPAQSPTPGPAAIQRGPVGRFVYGAGTRIGGGIKMGLGFLWGAFGVVLATLWRAATHLPSFGGGGGGGHSKPSGGGGGGHH